ncbi:hypothetical protein RJ639_013983 [Escallonia herrerae]|uniref:Uncharacterized protein n=1 Tax=Escallonia herrerae TaxID=1293975 RepID=A0AA88VFX7_9ASTE|nr:hypothetical protein RJ639_013983 [Escallonia herrerae]
MFNIKQIDFGAVPLKFSSSESKEGDNMAKQAQSYGAKGWKESGDTSTFSPFCSDLGYYEDNATEEGLISSKYQQEQQAQFLSAFGTFDDLYSNMVSPPFQSCQEEIAKIAMDNGNPELIESPKEKPHPFPVASLGILMSCRNRSKRLNGNKINVLSYNTPCTKLSGQKLSTGTVLRMAGESFIQSCSQRVDHSVLSYPFAKSFSGLSDEDAKDVDLVEYLLASAEKVGQQQFDCAGKLLSQCEELSSKTGSPVRRLVYYFSEALREKINRETGRIMPDSLRKKQPLDLDEEKGTLMPACVAFHKAVPFSQVSQFAGMQAIVENVAEAKKVHVIDLDIRNGIHCTVLMQALVDRHECPIKHLKITAIGTKSKEKIEETGKQLVTFAQSLNLPFCFNVVMVADMLDLKEDLFELDAEETVAVCSRYFLWTMIAQPDRLEYLIRVISNLKPCVMVIAETEANHNSPVFVNRFIEALFSYGALFDSLEDCMDHQDPNRMFTESIYFNHGIQSIVVAEGAERTVRSVTINVWRAFFARFGMEEIELTMSSLYQASLVIKNFACGSSCTLDMDDKCLIIGWKGTPVHSLSAWKFL